MAIVNLNTADFLKEGTNVTLTQDGNVIEVAATGGGGGEIDGGVSDSIYLTAQELDGGAADSVYL